MKALNKQALREAAKKTLNARARLELMESIFDDDGDITSEAQGDIKICTSFNDIINPATVLELLDELEAAEKRIAEHRKVLNSLAAVARRYLPDYEEHPEIQAADELLESTAGIGVKGE